MSYPNTAPILGTMTVLTPTGAGTNVSGTVSGLEAFDSVILVATLVGQKTGTVDLYVQSRHGDVEWVDVAHFAQVPAIAAQSQLRVVLSRYASVGTPDPVGTGMAPALAAGDVVPGEFGDALRLLCVGSVFGWGLVSQTVAVYAAACPSGSHARR